MLLAVICSTLGYLAFIVGMITGTPEVHSSRSSRTREMSSQCFNVHTRYGPNCLTTFWTEITYRFNGRTTKPLEHTTTPGNEKPTSRCQTFPSMWALGKDQLVISRVTFICWAMALPLSTIEFRYFRTVIVMIVIHRGFDRHLSYHQVTNFLDLPALSRS